MSEAGLERRSGLEQTAARRAGPTDDQRRAADPAASVWVTANAGSGKTKVLVDRICRLLLDGTPPGRLLCLTYTKAAAANVAIRAFERLGAWATMEPAELARQIEDLEGRAPPRARLDHARTLFARAVETPGGLKVRTIHAFCESILQLFPIEANVPARFAVLGDAEAAEIAAAARRALIRDALAAPDAPFAQAFARLVRTHGETGLEAALGEAARAVAAERRGEDAPEPCDALLARLDGQKPPGAGDCLQTARRALLGGGLAPDRAELCAALQGLGAQSDAFAAELSALAACGEEEAARRYVRLFHTDKGALKADKSLVVKAMPEALRERILVERDRVGALAAELAWLEARERTRDVLAVAAELDRRVEAEKSARGALDFEDIIARTRALLRRMDAAWVLYKLDGGIDHVLVDEAQDTSRPQWDILDRLTDEFGRGDGAREGRRTLFVVGDPKQSIFSFQGAAVDAMAKQRQAFAARLAEPALREVPLRASFRTVTDILQGVDRVFDGYFRERGLPLAPDADYVPHVSGRAGGERGYIEVWPTFTRAGEPDVSAWSDPVDAPGPGSPVERLARAVARAVERLGREGDALGRRHGPGDVMVLVRTRGPLFEALIRALERARVPVAGADRLRLQEHVAVLDLVALGRAVGDRADCLSLACALKSPLFGFDDDALCDLAAEREGPLREALRERAAERPLFAEAEARLERLERLARLHGPHGFFVRALGAEGGRRRLLARLGDEAADAIEEFLAQARDHELRRPPSLPAFLAAFEGEAVDVKRDLEAAGSAVRVMTVHAAKGLEAPVVILADASGLLEGRASRDRLVPSEDGSAILWAGSRGEGGAPGERARASAKARAQEEAYRLLYVAMTRARDVLIVAGAGKDEPADPPRWHDCVTFGLGDALRPCPSDDPEMETLWRFQADDAPSAAGALASPVPTPDEAEEDGFDPAALPWLWTPPEPEPPPLPPLKPSNALVAADAADRGLDVAARTPSSRALEARARARGQLVHLLLQVLADLPAEEREAAGKRLVALRAGEMSASAREAAVEEALRVIADPRLAPLFGPDARAEVSIAGKVEGRDANGAPVIHDVLGTIDRFALFGPDDGGDALICDYKTAARPPRSEAGIGARTLAQLALYRGLVAGAFPKRRVRCFVVWTAGPRVTEVSDARLDAALLALDAGLSPPAPREAGTGAAAP